VETDRRGQGEAMGACQGVQASWAGPEVMGQVEGGSVDSEGERRTLARQVFDTLSAYQSRSSTTKRNRTRARS
jgi:hypothetical protein